MIAIHEKKKTSHSNTISLSLSLISHHSLAMASSSCFLRSLSRSKASRFCLSPCNSSCSASCRGASVRSCNLLKALTRHRRLSTSKTTHISYTTKRYDLLLYIYLYTSIYMTYLYIYICPIDSGVFSEHRPPIRLCKSLPLFPRLVDFLAQPPQVHRVGANHDHARGGGWWAPLEHIYCTYAISTIY